MEPDDKITTHCKGLAVKVKPDAPRRPHDYGIYCASDLDPHGRYKVIATYKKGDTPHKGTPCFLISTPQGFTERACTIFIKANAE